MDDLLARQRNELKQLLANTQAMKHSVPKGDKKKKKIVLNEIAVLEAQLQEKHQLELQDLNKQESSQSTVDDVDGGVCGKFEEENAEDGCSKRQVKSKAQRRKERKVKEENEREMRIAQAEIENKNSLRNVEAEEFSILLSKMGLSIKEISPDGNCLYNAIADQLRHTESHFDWKELRSMTANQMRDNKADFLPFMTHPNTGEPYTSDEFYKYCEDVEGTNAWGGHIEVQALSRVLRTPIEIFQANSPILKIGEDFPKDPIRISYHRHAFGLGEHYNSVIQQIKHTEDGE